MTSLLSLCISLLSVGSPFIRCADDFPGLCATEAGRLLSFFPHMEEKKLDPWVSH